MTPLTRTAADGTTEYYCSTTRRYYRPAVARAGDGHVWTLCTECNTECAPLADGGTPQPHCYPVEGNDAPVN